MIEQIPTLKNQQLIDRWMDLIIIQAHFLKIIDANNEQFLETHALVKADYTRAL